MPSAAAKVISVIGLGSIGMRHARNLLAMGHRVYGVDIDKRREDELIRHGGDVGHVGYADGEIIATPSVRHVADINNTGLRVFVEKPIGVNEWDRNQLESCLSRVVMVGTNLRFHSCVKKAMGWMPLIGDPIWAYFAVSQANYKYSDHVVLNWGSHEVDLALHLLGPAVIGTAIGTDKIADLILLHGNGCRSTVHMDYLSEPHRRIFFIQGTNGSIEADLERRKATISSKLLHGGESFFGSDNWDQNYLNEMFHFVDVLDGKKSPIAATGEDGLACLSLLLEAISIIKQ